jgi:hypothetical protein
MRRFQGQPGRVVPDLGKDRRQAACLHAGDGALPWHAGKVLALGLGHGKAGRHATKETAPSRHRRATSTVIPSTLSLPGSLVVTDRELGTTGAKGDASPFQKPAAGL